MEGHNKILAYYRVEYKRGQTRLSFSMTPTALRNSNTYLMHVLGVQNAQWLSKKKKGKKKKVWVAVFIGEKETCWHGLIARGLDTLSREHQKTPLQTWTPSRRFILANGQKKNRWLMVTKERTDYELRQSNHEVWMRRWYIFLGIPFVTVLSPSSLFSSARHFWVEFKAYAWQCCCSQMRAVCCDLWLVKLSNGTMFKPVSRTWITGRLSFEWEQIFFYKQ